MEPALKIVLTGDVALELVAAYFREAGYDVHGPDSPPLNEFRPDFIYDITAHESTLAREVANFYDRRMEKLSGCRFSVDGIRAIVDEFAWERLRAPKKVLAVDADNTLWRGILSEDGAAALQPFVEFQRGLRQLRDEGVVLVLLSKNDPFEFRVDMPLKNDDFAAVRVNWSPKPGNLIEALRELNLSADSVVFVDDNPHERAQMSAHLPEVTVVPFPSDLMEPRQFLRRLREYCFFQLGKTDEDRLRAADYAANARRAELLRNCPQDFYSYLDDLELWVKPALADDTHLDRLAQMAGKTNQFNATTIRRSRADFAALLADPTKRIFVFRAGDRFGEQGIVCYVVADLQSRRITDFVMSCRAMGRTLEYFAYRYVGKALGYLPPIDFVSTPKNRPFANFLDACRDDNIHHHYKEI